MAVSLTNVSFASPAQLSLFRALIRINVYVLEHEIVRGNCERPSLLVITKHMSQFSKDSFEITQQRNGLSILLIEHKTFGQAVLYHS